MATKIETALQELSEVDGFLSANLVDAESGMSMGHSGNTDPEIDSVVSSKFYAAIEFGIDTLKLNDGVEGNLLTLGKTYHIVRPIEGNKKIFIHLALDRNKANLAMSRHALKSFVNQFSKGFK